MKRWIIQAKAETSILVADRRQAGNLQRPLHYIPGTAIRGAIAFGVPDSLRPLLATNAVRFENLYPTNEGYYLSLPLPLSARTCKYHGWGEDGGHPLVDFLMATDAEKKKCQGRDSLACGAPLERIYGNGLWLNGRFTQTEFPTTRTTMHLEIEDGKNVAREGVLFSLQQICEGTHFLGCLIFENENIEPQLWKACGGDVSRDRMAEIFLSVGQARSRGFGMLRCTIQRQSIPNGSIIPFLRVPYGDPLGKSVQERLQNFPGNTSWDQAGASVSFSLTLISDAILIDNFGRYLTGIGPEWVNYRMKGISNIRLKEAFCRNREVHGWNALHRLPRPTDIAILKGSCWRFEVTLIDKIDFVSSLTNLEGNGIGLRRNEGFGRLVVCHPFHTQVIWR